MERITDIEWDNMVHTAAKYKDEHEAYHEWLKERLKSNTPDERSEEG